MTDLVPTKTRVSRSSLNLNEVLGLGLLGVSR
jgi:hypothetical protein